MSHSTVFSVMSGWSHHFLGFNQYSGEWRVSMFCKMTQNGAASGDRPMISHYATALPYSFRSHPGITGTKLQINGLQGNKVYQPTHVAVYTIFEPRHERTNNVVFWTGRTQTELYKHSRSLEAGNFGFRKKRDCTIHLVKTKALISFEVTAKLISAFVFALAKCTFSHNAALWPSIQYLPRGREVSWLSFIFSLDRYLAWEKIPYGILFIWLCSMLIA